MKVRRGGGAGRILQRFENPADPEDPSTETLIYTLVDLGDGRTETTYHQVGHLPDEQYPLIEQGVNGFWDQLTNLGKRRSR